MRYGYHLQISIIDKVRKACLRTHSIRGVCHKDITDVKDELTDETYVL